MPYIKEELRPNLDTLLEKIEQEIRAMRAVGKINDKGVAGCLTYCVFKLIRRFYADGRWYDKMDAEKVCKSAMTEFMRRFVYPYEDDAIERNGDVE